MAKVKDVVCGMMIDPDTAAAETEYKGATYYFCSEDCLEAFEREPARYVGVEQHEPRFTTWKGVPAPKFGSAGSGGAEYELMPEAHDRDDS